MAVLMMPLSAVAPTIAARVGLRRVLLLGVGLFGIGLTLLATMVSATGGYLSVLPGLLVVGVGIGLGMSPGTMAISESLPAGEQGVASALNDTVRELGGAIGIALLGSIVNAGYRSSVSDVTASLSPQLATRVEDGIGSAFAASGDLGSSAPTVLNAARDALVDGWRLSMWFGVALAAFAFLFLVFRGPRPADATELVLAAELEPAA
jgi:MFS family permease